MKIIIPAILGAAETLAEEICSVQPMSNPFNKKEWPYRTDMLDFRTLTEVKEWCRSTFDSDNWTSTAQFFAFKLEKDYVLFKLRWK